MSELKKLLDEYDKLTGKTEQVGKQAALLAWRRSKKGGGKETQAEIAKDVGRNQQTISRWCRVGQIIDEGDERSFSEIYETTQFRSRSLRSERKQESEQPKQPTTEEQAITPDTPAEQPKQSKQAQSKQQAAKPMSEKETGYLATLSPLERKQYEARAARIDAISNKTTAKIYHSAFAHLLEMAKQTLETAIKHDGYLSEWERVEAHKYIDEILELMKVTPRMEIPSDLSELESQP